MRHIRVTGITGYSVLIKIAFVILMVLPVVNKVTTAQNELDVISDWLEYTDASNSLYRHLSGQAYDLLKQRVEKISEIKTPEEWQKRQRFIRETLYDIVGPFPEETPLNARVVRIIDKGSYRIEHIIYESQPGFYVTSSLFIPAGIKRGNRVPAVIYCSGHSAEGYRSAVYQHVILNLVKKGFIVFAFDPVGQGERLEYFDPETGKSIVGGPTREHSYPGAQAFLTGSSQALYMIWDGIRAIDYLLTRKEVDPARIGITGRSGGGTQSAYISAFDERIYAAAPENYITNYTRLLQTIGPQDAEQNLFNLISCGLDHPDLLIARAPKPSLMITTTRDMFSIQGAGETEKEVSGIYKAYGRADNFSRVEDDAPHASTTKNREAMYAFFQKHLNNPGDPSDEETQLLTAEELQVTETGQVSTSLKGETVFSINRKLAERLEERLNSLRKEPDLFASVVINFARNLSGYREPASVDEPVFTGRIRRDKYVIEKYFIKGEGEYVIPYLLFKPDNPGNRTMVYLHPSGKSAEALPGREIEEIVNRGITVLAPDLPGTGELGPGALKGDAYFEGASHNLWYASMLIGRTLTGIQAGDVVRLAMLIKESDPGTEITGYAREIMAPVMLHASAFFDDIKNIILIEPYSSFFSVVVNRFYNSHFILSTVPGALKEYDLPDLAASLTPRRLIIAGAKDGTGENYDSISISKDLEVIKAAYRNKKAENRLAILSLKEFQTKIKSAFE
jgi:cephalosporin-C deacetylase-like acetyl esterase